MHFGKRMQSPGAHKRLRKQTRTTLRTLLDGAYPVDVALNADCERGDFVQLATRAIGRGTSLHDAGHALRVAGDRRLRHADTDHRHLHHYREATGPILQGYEATVDDVLTVAVPCKRWPPARS